MNQRVLKEHGIDCDMGARRFLDDRALYEEMLTMFLSDTCFEQAEAAFAGGDYKGLFECGHTLKGTAGNLDMTALYRASGELTEYLRHNDAPAARRVQELFLEVQAAYRNVVEGISAAAE